MDEVERAVFVARVESLKALAKGNKISADDGEEARHWAVVYTELEKVSAYVQTYLVQESES